MAEEQSLDAAMDATLTETAAKMAEESPPEGSEGTPESTEAKGSAQAASEAPVGTVPVAEPPADDFPTAWKKEMRDHWTKLPPEVKAEVVRREKDALEGIRQYGDRAAVADRFQKAIQPYMETIQKAAGGDPLVAVSHLFNADHILRYGSNEEKISLLQTLVKNYGVSLDPDAPEKPAYVKELETRLARTENTLTASQQRMYEEARTKLDQEVQTFWKDPAHPYADELADDIVRLITAGYNLQEAYGRAVWSNPVTREKELARMQTQAKADLVKKSKEEADAAKKARGTNVTGRDSDRTPTEPLGTWDDTMKETLRNINART